MNEYISNPENEGVDIEAVTSKAEQMVGFKNPYASLESIKAVCGGNEILESCLDDMVKYSLKYAETVCRFEQVVLRGQASNENDARAEIERIRSTTHDATIDAINILARNIIKVGIKNEWISKLAGGGRSAYGKFAVLIAFEKVLRKV